MKPTLMYILAVLAGTIAYFICSLLLPVLTGEQQEIILTNDIIKGTMSFFIAVSVIVCVNVIKFKTNKK